MIHWYLIHAVHRTSDTMQAAIASFHAAGIERIVLLPDNGTLGPMGNTHRVLEFAVVEAGSHHQIGILQDDFVMCRDALTKLHRLEYDGIGYDVASLFTPANNVPHELREERGWMPLVPTVNVWGGCVVMKYATARQVFTHPNWQRHLLTETKRNKADACLFETLGLMGARCQQHLPSLMDHIGGDSSTIGNQHGEETRGYKWEEWA